MKRPGQGSTVKGLQWSPTSAQLAEVTAARRSALIRGSRKRSGKR
jgi:hypothetical protein